MFTKKFWLETFERAVKTAAQSVILAWGASAGANLFDLEWEQALGFGLGGFVLSVLTSVASGVVEVGEPNSPSLVEK